MDSSYALVSISDDGKLDVYLAGTDCSPPDKSYRVKVKSKKMLFKEITINHLLDAHTAWDTETLEQ